MADSDEILICRPMRLPLYMRLIVVALLGPLMGVIGVYIIWALGIAIGSFFNVVIGFEGTSINVFLISGAIVGFVWSIRGDASDKNAAWVLTNDELIHKKTEKRFPLASIIKVIVGLPAPGRMESNFSAFDQTGLLALQYNETLVIKFENNETLLLFLYAFEGGAAIMEALKTRMARVIDSNYIFTEEEKHLFNPIKVPSPINKLISVKNN